MGYMEREAMKTCNKCGQAKPFDQFAGRKDTRDGLNYRCKACDNTYQAERYKRNPDKIKRTPNWADTHEIKAIYIEAATRRAAGEDVHVDHDIPLRGKLVSGLHVANNLKIIPAADNLTKRNKFTPG